MEKPSRPARRRTSLFFLALGNSLDNTEGGLVNALFPMIRSSLGLGLETLGILSGVSRLSRMLVAPLWALAGDRYSRKALLFVATGVWSLWTVLAGLASNWDQLFWLYAIGALGTVAAEPLVNSLVADLYAEGERGRAYGAVRGIGALVLVASTPLIGLLTGTADGWRWGMFLMGGLGVASGVLILIFVREPERTGARHEGGADRFRWADLKHLAGNRTLLLMIPSVMLSTSLVLVSYLVTYLVDVRGLTNAQGTWALAATALGFVVSAFVGGRLGDLFEARWPSVGRVRLMQAYLLAYAGASVLALQVAWPSPEATYAVFGLLGLVSGIGYSGSVLPMMARVTPAEVRTSVFGFLFSFVQGGSTAALSLAVGYLVPLWGFPTVLFWIGTAPYLVNALLWVAVGFTYPRDSNSMREKM